MTALLAVDGLTAGYQPDLPIIHDISISVDTGEMVTIIGPNGAGKSTLIKAIAGLLPINTGAIVLQDKSVVGVSPDRMSHVGMAYVPQTDNIFATLTIDENLRLGSLPVGGPEARQRQMLAVARSLLTAPDILMLDEPSAGLAPKMVEEVFAHLVELVKTGIAILMVEQNAKAAMRISDRTYVMAEGRNRLDGKSAELLDDPEVARIYLGRAGGES